MASRIPALRPGRFGWGAAQLSGASLASRIIGFVYSAAVMRLAGPEAVGLFRLVWPLYATAFTLATSGVPYAMAKLVAERTGQEGGRHLSGAGAGSKDAAAVARQGFGLLFGFSVVAAGLLWACSPLLVGAMAGEARAVPSLRILAPSLVLATLASGGRALFEGVRRMSIPAASLLVEQAVLSGLAVYMTALLARRAAPPEQAAAALAMASVVGEAAGLVTLAIFVDRLWSAWRASSRARPANHVRPGGADRWWPVRAILALAMPVAGGRVLASIGGSLNSLVLPNRLLAAGLSSSEAAAQIGLLRGIAMPIVLMPNMLSLSLMTSLVPSISRALATGRRDLARLYSDKALAATLLFALPVTAALAVFPEMITRLLYGETQAAGLLLICSAAAPFVYLGQTLVGVLRGLGRPHVPVQAHLVGLAVDTLLLLALAGHPGIGIRGGALASVGGYTAAYLVNQVDAARQLGTGLRISDLALPAAGSLLGALAGRVAASAVLTAVAGSGAPTMLADAAGLAAGMLALGAVYGMALWRCSLWRWVTGH